MSRRVHPTGRANNTSRGEGTISLLHTLTRCLHTNPLSKGTRLASSNYQQWLLAVETGGQGNCPIEISPLGQKAGNFWANCEGQVAHLGATRGHQASVTTVCPKPCNTICHTHHGILQVYSAPKALAAGSLLLFRPFTLPPGAKPPGPAR